MNVAIKKKSNVHKVATTYGLVVCLFVSGYTFVEQNNLRQKTDNQQTLEVSNELEKVHTKEMDETNEIPTTPPKESTKIMGEDKFVNLAKEVGNRLGVKSNIDTYSHIYKNSLEHGVPPFLLLGIGWKESKFNPNVNGPETRYGVARGMFQIIDPTAKQLGMNPNDAYNPKIASSYAAQLVKEYSNWFAGKEGEMGMPDRFKNFKEDGQYSLYFKNGKWIPVVDHKGQKLSRLLLATMSYNCGPGKIANAMEKHGFVVVDPKSEHRSLPHQTLEYVLLIGEKYYNFEYNFDYTHKDVNRNLASKNM